MDYALNPIGMIRTPFTELDTCPKMENDGGKEAVLKIDSAYEEALDGMEEGQELILLTWLHLSDRSVLTVHPRGDRSRPKRGVFTTRSPVRPNPIGMHRVRLLERKGLTLRVFPLETMDKTPLIDIKSLGGQFPPQPENQEKA